MKPSILGGMHADACRRFTRLMTMATFVLAVTCAGAAPVLGQNRTAPAFKVKDVAGEALDLEKLLERGPVLLDYWATWCKPCVASLPEIQLLHERYGNRGLTVVGISIDGPRNRAKVRPFAQRLGLTYPIAIDDDGRLQRQYQIRAVPTSVLIDSDGSILLVNQGYRPGEIEMIEAALDKALPAVEEDADAS